MRQLRGEARVLEHETHVDAVGPRGAEVGEQRCIVSVPGATFQYTHEFDGRLGSGLQLGPITDRYLLNIHLAMHGASVPLLSGPVGVGKTSLVRQAATVLGRFLIEMQWNQ